MRRSILDKFRNDKVTARWAYWSVLTLQFVFHLGSIHINVAIIRLGPNDSGKANLGLDTFPALSYNVGGRSLWRQFAHLGSRIRTNSLNSHYL